MYILLFVFYPNKKSSTVHKNLKKKKSNTIDFSAKTLLNYK